MNELGSRVAELVEKLGERRREYGELKKREEHLVDALRAALEALEHGRAICRLHADTLSLAQDRTLGEKVAGLSCRNYEAGSRHPGTCGQGGSGQVNADASQAFGIRWQTWGRLSVASWLGLFTASHLGLGLTWGGLEALSFVSFGLGLALVIGGNIFPGAAAWLSAPARKRLLSLPEASALGSLTFSAGLGLYAGFVLTRLYLEVSPFVALQGIVCGIVFFPLTFGIVFPLGIPLACSLALWSLVRTRERISPVGFAFLTGSSTIGWIGVAVVGTGLGLAG